MRIKKNDIPVSIYQYTAAPAADGLVVSTYTIRYSGIGADVQPAGSKFDPALYGINSTPSNVREMYYDSNISMVPGDVVLALTHTYMVKGVRTWYDHQEAVLEPYDVVLP